MGEKENKPFQLSFNGLLKVDFQGSRVTSDGGLIRGRALSLSLTWRTPPVYSPSRPLRYSSRTLCAKRMSPSLAFPIFGPASRQVCFARGMTSSSNTLEALARVSGF